MVDGERKKLTLVPTKNTHSWGHCHNPSQKTLISDLKTLWGVCFIDIVPVIEVQGLIIPTEMGQENKIWHNP
jgi:hypothetical protein